MEWCVLFVGQACYRTCVLISVCHYHAKKGTDSVGGTLVHHSIRAPIIIRYVFTFNNQCLEALANPLM